MTPSSRRRSRRPASSCRRSTRNTERVYYQLFESSGRPMFAARIASLRDVVRRSAPAGAVHRRRGGIMADAAQRAGLEFDISGAAAYPDIVAVARIALAGIQTRLRRARLIY